MRIIELITYLAGIIIMGIGIIHCLKASSIVRQLVIKKEKEKEDGIWRQEADLQMQLKNRKKFQKVALAGIIIIFISLTKFAYFS